MKCCPFLTEGLQVNFSKKQIEHKANIYERQLRLIMHGIPPKMVDHATADQLAVMEEIVNRDIESELKIQSAATTNGIATAFGGKS